MVRLITATGAPRRRGRRKGRRRHRVPLRLPRTEAATGPTFTPPFRARLGEWAAAAASASARPDNRIVLPSPGTTSLSSFSGDPAGWVSVQCRPRLSPGAAENELQLVDFFQRCHIGRGSQEGTNENLGKAKVSNMRNHVLPKKNVAMISCCRFPMLAGNGPSKLLLSRESCCSCVKFPSEDGMIPDNRSSSCADRLVIEFGSAPPSLLVQFVKNVMNLQSLTLVAFSWFLCSIRYFRQSIPISGGTIPVKLLEERSMERMLVAFAIEGGMLPVKWFKATMKYWIFGHCPNQKCQPLKTADLAKGLRDWSSEVILIEEKFRQRREVAKYKKIQVRNSESPVD
uniref:Uncharacterized protein n=1 Tax=Oryza glumipatula TaxID=40148 RepID=A0A0E0B9R5_9ORYZ